MRQPYRVRLGFILSVVALLSSACTATRPAGGPSTAGAFNPPGVAACGPVLTAAEMEGGFLDDDLQPPASGTVVEAVLATGAGGPQLTGRTILFRGVFNGPLPVAVDGGAMTALEVGTSVVGTPECAGSVRIAVPSEILVGRGKGDAFAEADLGSIHVGGASIFCTALTAGTGTIAVECPSLGIRVGDQASTGTLWLRFRSAGQPQTAASLPDWVGRLMGSPAATSTGLPSEQGGGTITIDGEEFAIQPGRPGFEGVFTEPHGNVIWYRATLAYSSSEGWSQYLSIEVPAYDGPGLRTTGTIVRFSETYSVGGGLPSARFFSSKDCRVEVGVNELTGSASCQLSGEFPETGSKHVAATWAVAAVEDHVGPPVRVHWTIGGAYVSEGQATVLTEVNTQLDPSILRVLEVLVGHPGTSDLLRIDIRGFTGDGVYTGDAVDPSIQDVGGNSPSIRLNFATSSEDPAGPGDSSEPWSPAMGQCTATVTDGGRSGSIRCPGFPGIEDNAYGGSTTLYATWEPG